MPVMLDAAAMPEQEYQETVYGCHETREKCYEKMLQGFQQYLSFEQLQDHVSSIQMPCLETGDLSKKKYC